MLHTLKVYFICIAAYGKYTSSVLDALIVLYKKMCMSADTISIQSSVKGSKSTTSDTFQQIADKYREVKAFCHAHKGRFVHRLHTPAQLTQLIELARQRITFS